MYAFDWRVDYNVNRMISYEEVTKAYSSNNRMHIWEAYWNDWLLVDASEATELSWDHINIRKSIQDENKQWWNSTLYEHDIHEVYENTTITLAEATEWFASIDAADLDRDGDAKVRYSEFCM